MPVLAARPDGTFQIAWLQAGRVYAAALPAAPADRDVVELDVQ
jgi:hypothetical protein